VSRFITIPGQTIFEDDGVSKRSGLTLLGGDFVVTVYKDCAINALPVTISEIGATGTYCLQYTPPTAGYWSVELRIVFSDDILCSRASVGQAADLSTLLDEMGRVLSLLHFNSMVDLQEFADPNEQLTKWRHRGFDTDSNVPATPGGNETVGKKYEHEFEAEYDGPNKPKMLKMKKVL
jgi:hypothetical protein